jgi:hypothetical protein
MDVLERAEAIDGYRQACNENSLNAQAREGHVYELSNITLQSYNFLRNAIDDYPILEGSEYAILDSTADNGFPHTRPNNLICLPASMCKEAPASKDFRVTLVHEGIHIHQRKFKNEWDKALEKAGWNPISKDSIPEEFRDRVRINPDTMMCPFWAFKTYHVPLSIFRHIESPKLNDVVVEWLDLRTGAVFHEPPKSFREKYTRSFQQPEHPYEIYAEIFSEAGFISSDQILENLKRI